MKADCSAKFLMWPKFAFYLEICDPTLNKRHLVIQKSERSLKNMGSPAIAIGDGPSNELLTPKAKQSIEINNHFVKKWTKAWKSYDQARQTKTLRIC